MLPAPLTISLPLQTSPNFAAADDGLDDDVRGVDLAGELSDGLVRVLVRVRVDIGALMCHRTEGRRRH